MTPDETIALANDVIRVVSARLKAAGLQPTDPVVLPILATMLGAHYKMANRTIPEILAEVVRACQLAEQTRDPRAKRRFRPHRGALADSIAEVIAVKDRAELIKHLSKDWPKVDYAQMVVEPYQLTPDNRIGWPQTWIVLTCPDGPVLGFTDGPLV